MRLSNKYGGIQFFAPSQLTVHVNDSAVMLAYKDGADTSWSINASLNTTIYSIDSDNRVVWNDGKFLAYNGAIVLGSESIIASGNYTTVEGGGLHQ